MTIKEWLMYRAAQAAPEEACGFIMRDGSIIEIPNIASDPITSFQMDRRHLIEKVVGREDDIMAIWHTHPKGSRVPSYTDLKAISMGAIWPTWTYLIATKDDLSEFNTSYLAPQPNSFWSAYVR